MTGISSKVIEERKKFLKLLYDFRMNTDEYEAMYLFGDKLNISTVTVDRIVDYYKDKDYLRVNDTDIHRRNKGKTILITPKGMDYVEMNWIKKFIFDNKEFLTVIIAGFGLGISLFSLIVSVLALLKQ